MGLSCLLDVSCRQGVNILPKLQNCSMQIRRCVLKFCQFDKISIRICVFANMRPHHFEAEVK